MARAFPYDAKRDGFTCPAGQILSHQALLNPENGVHTHLYRAPKQACPSLSAARARRPAVGAARMAEVDYPPRRTGSNDGLQNPDEDRRGAQIYAQLSQIAEFPHAWIKERCGLR